MGLFGTAIERVKWRVNGWSHLDSLDVVVERMVGRAQFETYLAIW
mgnify:FL=1